jgi:predicted lipid-binding transport protein (Tim44 family)
MQGQLDAITLISLIVAVIAILKLRSVLGQRTGDEEQRQRLEKRHRVQTEEESENVVKLPRRDREFEDIKPAPTAPVKTTEEVEARIKAVAGDDKETERGLLAILKQDPDFDIEPFVKGAKIAYEMIVTAFAEGNRKALKDLLSREVFDGFANAISAREQRGETVEQQFVAINKADIIDADLKDGIASVTVRFLSQLISATRDKAGAVISGDATKIRDVTDIWTFSRDISSPRARAQPNWRLVATQAPN